MTADTCGTPALFDMPSPPAATRPENKLTRKPSVRRTSGERARALLEEVRSKLPSPFEVAEVAEGDCSPLSEKERAQLRAAEETVRTARGMELGSLWIMGAGLEVIARGRLYRANYTSFNQYVRDELGISVRKANYLRSGYSLGLAVATRPVGEIAPLSGRSARALVPVKQAHGLDAATTFYELAVAAAQEEGRKLTSELLEAAAGMLPADLPTGDGERRALFGDLLAIALGMDVLDVEQESNDVGTVVPTAAAVVHALADDAENVGVVAYLPHPVDEGDSVCSSESNDVGTTVPTLPPAVVLRRALARAEKNAALSCQQVTAGAEPPELGEAGYMEVMRMVFNLEKYARDMRKWLVRSRTPAGCPRPRSASGPESSPAES
ncbi:hypothetical protein [Streptomyces sp. CS014]|uniref:hypothetical protein n=1 Tax=Streptomyces sp. CS014 TaxID=2162707 RepID=UPI000D507D65|nr:hypothetical protein [Streptomyces sp. CS014]PVD04487.1 hypothetical protein DBP12_03415 [Streptomyces sp. CS014]